MNKYEKLNKKGYKYMKEKIVELIKSTRIYPILKKILFQTKEKNYKSKFLTSNNTNLYISELLKSKKPFVISRLGTTELGILKSYEKDKSYEAKQRETIKRYSGFFPIDNENLDKFCKLYEEIIPSMDLVGISLIPFEDYMLNRFAPNAKLTKLRNLEPYFYQDPWSQYLKNKKVLVIHPFASSINIQFEKRRQLFKNLKVLPDFQLTTYRAAQTLGGGNGEFSSWFEALDKMQKDVSKIDFDIAIIGAGVYGLPLAHYVKSIGKSAIHLGGATQMLFGVYGRRWEIHPDFQDIINEHWIKPALDEKPKNSANVENACYW